MPNRHLRFSVRLLNFFTPVRSSMVLVHIPWKQLLYHSFFVLCLSLNMYVYVCTCRPTPKNPARNQRLSFAFTYAFLLKDYAVPTAAVQA